ncbi:endonuclease (plasmid) [Fulvitalea axinellae]|uniref:Endonuclease n=1 Tax=Fulvitalea axinellae TaxID=1182444 RepID=A0AAU9CK32_9BACT|nr:endonuclease [Fulvitalea axinellae]
MKKLLWVVALVFAAQSAWAWGQTGHRVIGELAQRHLSKKAAKEVKKILGDEDLAGASNWFDFIKSDSKYDHTHCWHYATIPDGKTYAEVEKDSCGDIIEAIARFKKTLASETATLEEKKFALRGLVHMMGDVHQPLHVGNGTDRGANDVKVEWFWRKSNLHRVWDSGIIDKQQLSYTEYANKLDHYTKAEKKQWQNDNIDDWVKENISYRPAIYNIGNGKLSYRYIYEHLDTLEGQLRKGGMRLAATLNTIFG